MGQAATHSCSVIHRIESTVDTLAGTGLFYMFYSRP